MGDRQCDNFGPVLGHLFKTDVSLFADVFENFRAVCFKIYTLDPACIYAAPVLSFSAMLKTTRERMELLTDLFLFFNTEFSLTQCVRRHSIAANQHTDLSAESDNTFIVYLDANNLYSGEGEQTRCWMNTDDKTGVHGRHGLKYIKIWAPGQNRFCLIIPVFIYSRTSERVPMRYTDIIKLITNAAPFQQVIQYAEDGNTTAY